MLRESEFIQQLRALVGLSVHGVDNHQKAEIIRRLSEQLISADAQAAPEIHWVPFITGRRPVDEADFPGLGSSDHVALILSTTSGDENQTFLLYRIGGITALSEEDRSRYEVRLTLSFAGPWGDLSTEALPGWQSRVVPLLALERNASGSLHVRDASLNEAEDRSFVIPLSPVRDFLPGEGWRWEDLDRVIRVAATDGEDPFTLGHLFIQQLRAELVLLCDGVPVSAAQLMIDVCDGRRFGSLYSRVVDKVIKPDTEQQRQRNRIPSLDFAHHPWFPVLLIGADKAELYTRALIEDIVHKKRHLTDPRWLLRVGLYLELLTCIGIFEAVKDDLGDLLTADERKAYDESEWFAPIRKAVNPAAWKKVWELRGIVMPPVGSPNAGNVSSLNLLAKKKATLAFLHAHHEDLKAAIRLAGANTHNAQETWHRVFRDAERAVLRKTPDAFPELAAFPEKAQQFVLWHQRGRIGGLSVPTVSSWFGDQDGLYASACNQYRASMNYVALWAKREGLMDYSGTECVPEQVSLFRTYMDGQSVRLAQLQRRDGYAGTIEVAADLPSAYQVNRETLIAMLRQIPIFNILSAEELETLASTVRPIELGPVERIIVQGREGSSLFVVAEGKLEVMVRQSDGFDLSVATLEPGSVFGEMSLLTGERRSATVRSIDSAVVYEVGQKQLTPLLEKRPESIDQLAEIMEPRLQITTFSQRDYEMTRDRTSLGRKIRSFLLSQ